MSALKRKLKNKKPPEGWDMIEEVIEDFEQQMKDAVADEHEGKRKCEANWKIHRIHWEKNRFIYDLMYVRKVMSRELVSHAVRSKPRVLVHSRQCPVVHKELHKWQQQTCTACILPAAITSLLPWLCCCKSLRGNQHGSLLENSTISSYRGHLYCFATI